MRIYSRRSFLFIKIPFVLLLLTVVFNLGKERGHEEIRQTYPAITYQDQGRPYCWNLEIYPAVKFNPRTMTVAVRQPTRP